MNYSEHLHQQGYILTGIFKRKSARGKVLNNDKKVEVRAENDSVHYSVNRIFNQLQ